MTSLQVQAPPRQYDDADALLAAFSAHINTSLRPPIDVEGIAAFLNISVNDYIDLENPEIIGKISASGGVVAIDINAAQNSYVPRRRFTLAHEIGHYCLHFHNGTQKFIDTKSSMSRSESYWDLHESQANSFAAQLLMPADLILEGAEDIIGEYINKTSAQSIPRDDFIGLMSERFNVSNVAMEYRLIGMDILSPKQI